MEVHKVITKIEPSELEFEGATLLSAEEAMSSPKLARFEDWWWLRSSVNTPTRAAIVYGDGFVDDDEGASVEYNDVFVRPALIIKNLESSDFNVGDTFILDFLVFEIVSENLAFCKNHIGRHCFRKDRDAPNSNEYEASDVKRYIDEWFENVTER